MTIARGSVGGGARAGSVGSAAAQAASVEIGAIGCEGACSFLREAETEMFAVGRLQCVFALCVGRERCGLSAC